MKRSNFVFGSLIVALSSLVIRLISFCYQVFLIRTIGAEGIGIFHMIMPIFMIGLTITTSGLPTAISKLVSKSKAVNDKYKIRQSFNVALAFVLVLSIIVSSVLYLGSNILSSLVFGNTDYAYLIIMLIPAIVFISINSMFRGLLYGLNKMFKASVSEFIEHITRFITVIVFVLFFMPQNSTSVIYIAFIALSVGDFFALTYLYNIYKGNFPNTYSILTRSFNKIQVLTQLLKTSLPLTFLRFIRLINQSITATMLPKMLMLAGFTQLFATQTFGRIMGMTIPIIFIPFLFTSALVINLIPSITHQLQLKNSIALKKDIKLAIKIIMAISIPLTVIIFLFSNKIGVILYNDVYVGSYIKTLSSSIVFISINHVLYGILFGLGKERAATINSITGMLIQVSSIFVLVPNPNYNIYGFLYGFIASSVVTCLLHLRVLKNNIRLL